jgi:hypothetical protein
MEHKLRVYKNKEMWTIFESKREEITGDWRSLYYMELHNFHSTPIYFPKDKIGSKFRTCVREERFIKRFGGEILGNETVQKTEA